MAGVPIRATLIGHEGKFQDVTKRQDAIILNHDKLVEDQKGDIARFDLAQKSLATLQREIQIIEFWKSEMQSEQHQIRIRSLIALLQSPNLSGDEQRDLFLLCGELNKSVSPPALVFWIKVLQAKPTNELLISYALDGIAINAVHASRMAENYTPVGEIVLNSSHEYRSKALDCLVCLACNGHINHRQEVIQYLAELAQKAPESIRPQVQEAADQAIRQTKDFPGAGTGTIPPVHDLQP